MTKKKVAVFDVDGTLFRSSLLIEIVETLIAAGLFPKKARDEFKKEHVLWLDRKGDYEAYINAVVKVFMKYIKGVPYDSFMNATEEMLVDKKDRMYRYTRNLVRELKRRGYFLLAISQSPKGILDKFCLPLGFNKVYGRIYELGPQNKFTGKIEEFHMIENKANIIKRAVEKENLTLKGSVGVGDTESDISFLELVESPVCFNPNQKLYRYAKLNKWKIVVERKDVVYELPV